MTKIDEQSLEFSKQHHERFEDSDFFPPLSEYEAIWSQWEGVKTELMASNIQKLGIHPAFSMPIAKGRHTFRVVHQLDPTTSLIYTAIAHYVGAALEQARSASGYSYRFRPDQGAFFGDGTGYQEFRQATRNNAETVAYTATADITDFYNQIYSHRVSAAIEAADNNLSGIARDLDGVIQQINANATKGIPVGPNASGVFSEAILLDIDRLIEDAGVRHTRYVDDIRIFSDNEEKIKSTIEELSFYLYSNHRLHLNSEKTKIYFSGEFIEVSFVEKYDEAVEEAIGRLQAFDIYDHEEIDDEASDVDDDVIEQVGRIIIENYEEDDFVDLNLLKTFLRTSRAAKSAACISALGNARNAFLPVFHEVGKTLSALLETEAADEARNLIQSYINSEICARHSVKVWLGWLCAGDAELLRRLSVREFVNGLNSPRILARSAVTTRNLVTIRSFARSGISSIGHFDRPAVLGALSILGSDERKAIIRTLNNSSLSVVDNAVIRYIQGG